MCPVYVNMWRFECEVEDVDADDTVCVLVGWKHQLLTYLLTPWSRVPLEKLTGFQLIKKFPAYYGTRRSIAAFTGACNLSLSWASSIQSIPPHPTSWRSILILSHLHLVLPSGLLWKHQCRYFTLLYVPSTFCFQRLYVLCDSQINNNHFLQKGMTLLCLVCCRKWTLKCDSSVRA